MAPVPRIRMMLGKALGGATVAMLQGLLVVVVCLIAGFRPVSWPDSARNGLHGADRDCIRRSGDRNRIRARGYAGLPTDHELSGDADFFLSGALFPLSNLPKLLNVITSFDPLTYGVDGLRGALLGIFHFGVMTDIAVLCAVALAFISVGSYFFSRIQL